MIIIPNNGPKKAPKVSIIDNTPTWLKYVSQNIPTTKPIIEIIKPALLIDKVKGKKLIKEYWDGIKLAIKLVDAEAIIIIHSDHGHAFYTDFQLPLDKWEKKSINGRSSILLAIKASKECRSNAYKDISPVNIFRLVFACLNNSKPQFLKDKHYIHHEKFSELLLIE